MGGSDTTGKLLADIANLISEGLRVLSLSDKRQWGQDEHEQVQALEVVLDEARKDFQELGPLVNGRSQYEHDRRYESLRELESLCAKFRALVQNLRDWTRSGGPIDPTWTRDTQKLQRELHRTQCRVAMRIFTSSHEASERCLGAFVVHRVQRAGNRRAAAAAAAEEEDMDYQKEKRKRLEELDACRRVGTFQRFGERDIAFVCDFCDGHLVWHDLEHMPTSRSILQSSQSSSSSSSSSTNPSTANPPTSSLSSSGNWQATGTAHSGEHQKQIIFAPVAIANHIAPLHGDWEARLLCPLCEEIGEQAEDEDAEEEEEEWRPDDDDHFDDLASLQEHLEWQHAPAASSILTMALPDGVPSLEKCTVM